MNNNALLEASNLNNPFPLLRRTLRGVNSSNKTEMQYTENLEPAILALRTEASHCMRMQNKEPRESYDFQLPLPQGLVIQAPHPHLLHGMPHEDSNVESLDINDSLKGSSYGGHLTNKVDGISLMSE